MKKFVKKLLVFLLLLLTMAIIAEHISDRSIRNYNENGWADIYNSKINANLIIQGNSRANYNILPNILDSILKTNSYNLGVPGFHFFMQYYRFLVYMKHNKAPKYIIQTTDNVTIHKQDDFLDYTQFFPYFGDSLVKEEIKTSKLFDWKVFYIPYYKYIGNFDIAYLSLRDCFRKFNDSNRKYKGSLPKVFDHTVFFKYNSLNSTPTKTEVDTAALNLFTKFLNFCKTNNIQVVLVFTPYYYTEAKKISNLDSIMGIFRKYSVQYNLPFLDYSNDSLCLDSLNFGDTHHLNMAGSKKFSCKLAHDLKSVLK